MKTVLRTAIPVLFLTLGFLTSAHALKPQIPPVTPAVEDGQKPPEETLQKPEEKKECIADKSEFKTVGKVSGFMIALENSCAARYRCKVSAYVTNSHGAKQGNATITLAPMVHGQPGQGSYMLNTGAASGTANASHSCKTI
jgi:hypothetical protein